MSIFRMKATGTSYASSAPDLEEVRRALEILADPEHGCELRGLPSGRSRVRAGNDLAGLGDAAKMLSDDRGVYYCLNPGPVGIGDRAYKMADILNRRWLLIDIDPVKAEPDNSATDAEKDAARGVATDVMDWLGERGWPGPVMIDSGNGWHLLYRVDLPADEHSRALIKRILYDLAARFTGTSAAIDRAVHNASRIAKLPGTWACKGEASDSRPYRIAKLLHVPEPLEVVTLVELQAAAGAGDETVIEQRPSRWTLHAGTGDHRAYARAALQGEVGRVLLATPGGKDGQGRNDALNDAAFRMGTIVGAGWMLQQEVEAALGFAAVKAGLKNAEIGPTLKSGLEAGKLQPRQAPKAKPVEAPKLEPGERIIYRASEVKPRKVEWLWPGRIPLGKLTTFAGVGGLGKTFVLCDITARITRGMPWPDGNGECFEPGQVLFVSGEDDVDDTLVPRMIEMNADLSRVVFLKTEIQDCFTLADLGTLSTAIEQAGSGIRFVAIDPPTAFLGGVNDHKNAELRALLSPLKSWSSAKHIAMAFNTHITKGSGIKVEAMMRVMGSVAWVNAVRAAHLFVADPEDRTRRLFVGMKNNLGRELKALAYRIADTKSLARVEWMGEVDITADEAMNRERKPRKVEAAVWLEELFAGIDELPSKAIWQDKKGTTLSDDALKEAKEYMGIRAKKTMDSDGCQRWTWYWPAEERAKWMLKKGDEQAI